MDMSRFQKLTKISQGLQRMLRTKKEIEIKICLTVTLFNCVFLVDTNSFVKGGRILDFENIGLTSEYFSC